MKQQQAGGQAVADQIPICCSLDFSQTPFFYTYIVECMNVCVLNSDLHEIQPVPHLPEHNSYVSWGMSTCTPWFDIYTSCSFSMECMYGFLMIPRINNDENYFLKQH